MTRPPALRRSGDGQRCSGHQCTATQAIFRRRAAVITRLQLREVAYSPPRTRDAPEPMLRLVRHVVCSLQQRQVRSRAQYEIGRDQYRGVVPARSRAGGIGGLQLRGHCHGVEWNAVRDEKREGLFTFGSNRTIFICKPSGDRLNCREAAPIAAPPAGLQMRMNPPVLRCTKRPAVGTRSWRANFWCVRVSGSGR
jgi:hypothetical protein